MDTLIELLKNKVISAQKVLIGIGKEIEYINNCEDKSLAGYYYVNANDDTLIGYYQKLYELIKDKDYYVISLCVDDLIYKVFPEDRIVTPCGNTKNLQCEDNCSNELYLVKEYGTKIINKIALGENVTDEDYMLCPNCNKKLVVNNITANVYNEAGYLDKFAEYKKWLQTTVNKELVMIEIGVGMRFPTVIRLPFDKMCFYNQKCSFFRIHETLYQHTAENKDRGISIKADAKTFFEML